jgi:uncharacterized membrane protein YcaP (DUF421 family)
MDPVIRAASVYVMLLLLFRLSGKRALAQITTFDFVLLLIISEAIQNALIGNDFSLTTAGLVVTTLLVIDVGLSVLTQRFPRLDKLVEDVPLILVAEGRPIAERMKRARVSESDILDAARQTRGLDRMSQIRFAILERAGGISIIPNPPMDPPHQGGPSDHPTTR